MNKSQIATLQAITRRIQGFYGGKGQDGTWTFKVTRLSDDVVQLSGSNNNDLRWYETERSVVADIGPRGGVKWSNVENMSNKLVFDRD